MNVRRPMGLAQAAVMITVVTVVARAVGFGRVLVFARTVGPTCLGDAYYTANTIPNIVFEIVAGGALASLVVPVLAGAVDRGDAATARHSASALMTWAVVLLVPLALLGVLLAHPLMALLVGGGHPPCSRDGLVDVGARMLVVFMPQVVLYGVGIVLTGILQAHRRFLGPALAPLLSSLVVIGAYLAYGAVSSAAGESLRNLPLSQELLLSVGTTGGVVALSLPLLVPLRRTPIRLRPTLSFPPGVAAQVRRLAFSGAAVLAGQQIATAVVLRLANAGGTSGAVVLYNLAWTVYLVPWAVLAVPIATSAFPTLSARHEAGEHQAYAQLAAGATRAVVLVTAAAAAVLVAAAAPTARVLVLGARGDVDPAQLAWAIAAFAPGLLGYGLLAHVSRALYARGDARSPAIGGGHRLGDGDRGGHRARQPRAAGLGRRRAGAGQQHRHDGGRRASCSSRSPAPPGDWGCAGWAGRASPGRSGRRWRGEPALVSPRPSAPSVRPRARASACSSPRSSRLAFAAVAFALDRSDVLAVARRLSGA